jgi:hypothetical protein
VSRVRWIETSPEVYAVIRARHHEGMRVHGTITHLGETGDPQSRHLVTEWGLPGADVPLIRSQDRGGVFSYALAVVMDGDDE